MEPTLSVFQQHATSAWGEEEDSISTNDEEDSGAFTLWDAMVATMDNTSSYRMSIVEEVDRVVEFLRDHGPPPPG